MMHMCILWKCCYLWHMKERDTAFSVIWKRKFSTGPMKKINTPLLVSQGEERKQQPGADNQIRLNVATNLITEVLSVIFVSFCLPLFIQEWTSQRKTMSWLEKLQKYGLIGRVARRKRLLFKKNMAAHPRFAKHKYYQAWSRGDDLAPLMESLSQSWTPLYPEVF